LGFLHCSSCHGKLIDEEILHKIESVTAEEATPAIQAAQADPGERLRNCPTCRIAMQKTPYGKLKAKTTIDKCPKCSYIWLDQGELEAIQASYALYAKQISAKGSPDVTEFNCPKCGFAQQKKTECVKCGIIFSKFTAQDAIYKEQQYNSEKAASRVDAIFAEADSFEIKQIHEWGEIITDLETANRYSIKAAGTFFEAHEVSKGLGSLLTRSFLSAYRAFEINLWDLQNNHILELKRPFRFYFHQLSIADANGNAVGTIVREFSIINKKFSVFDARGKQVMSIHGPLIRPWTFFIKKSEREIGKISKKWSGLLKEAYTDSDTFGVKFNKKLDNNSKYIMLGAVFLIDFLYFEK